MAQDFKLSKGEFLGISEQGLYIAEPPRRRTYISRIPGSKMSLCLHKDLEYLGTVTNPDFFTFWAKRLVVSWQPNAAGTYLIINAYA